MTEHYGDGTIELADGRVVATCTCGWRGDPIVPDRDAIGRITDATFDWLDERWMGHIRPLITPDPSLTLILIEDRHHLDGEPLTNGTPLELLLPNDGWWRGRYETTRRDGGALVPLFYARIGGPALTNGALDFAAQIHFELPAHAVLRRPS